MEYTMPMSMSVTASCSAFRQALKLERLVSLSLLGFGSFLHASRIERVMNSQIRFKDSTNDRSAMNSSPAESFLKPEFFDPKCG